jgi:hypothetical protein
MVADEAAIGDSSIGVCGRKAIEDGQLAGSAGRFVCSYLISLKAVFSPAAIPRTARGLRIAFTGSDKFSRKLQKFFKKFLYRLGQAEIGREKQTNWGKIL